MSSSLQPLTSADVHRAVARTLEAMSTPAFATRAHGAQLLANQAATASLLPNLGTGLPRFAAVEPDPCAQQLMMRTASLQTGDPITGAELGSDGTAPLSPQSAQPPKSVQKG